MDSDDRTALSCGHFAQSYSVCQYGNCMNQVCKACTARCSKCPNMLCLTHREEIDNGQIICEDHLPRHTLIKLGKTLINRR